MPAPQYHARGGWLAGDWVEIGSKYTWAQISGNFRWEELQAGPIPDTDLEELQVSRKIATMFDRLSTGEARLLLDNARGQYTGFKSAQNMLAYSDNVASGTYWVTDAAATSLNLIHGKYGAIDAAALSENNANSTHGIRSPGSVSVLSSGGLVMVAGEFFAGTRDRLQLLLSDPTETHLFRADFSLRSMTMANLTAANSGTAVGASMQAVGDGWVKCWVVGTLPGPVARARTYMVNSAGATTYTGTGSAWLGLRALQAAWGAYLPNEFVGTYGAEVVPGNTNIAANDMFTIKAVDGSSIYNIFAGYVEQWGFNPSLRDGRKIAVSCVDVAERLRPIISTSMMVNVTHRTVLQAVMDEVGIDPLQYSIDPMSDICAFAYLDQMTAGQALAQVQQNGAQVYYVDGGGALRMRNRYWNATSIGAVASFAVGLSGNLALDMSDIINRVRVATIPRIVAIDVRTVGWITDPIHVPASTTKQFVVDFIDATTNETGVPVLYVEDQVRSVDYLFNTAPTGKGGDMTSQISVVANIVATAAEVTVSNPGPGNGYLVLCQFFGRPASRQPELARIVEDAASIAQHQERYATVQADLLGTENRLSDLGRFTMHEKAAPKYRLQWALKNEWPAVYALDLADGCWVGNSISNVSSLFYVNELEHTITFANGPEHILGMKLELAPVRNWFTLSSPSLGRLNFNRLGV